MCGIDTQVIPIWIAGGEPGNKTTAVQPRSQAIPIGPFLGISVAMLFKLRKPVSQSDQT